MKKLIIILGILLLTFGCINLEKPATSGNNCDFNEDCLVENFYSCTKAHATIQPDTNTEFYFQIIGPKEDKCEIYVELNKADELPDLLSGLNATCTLSFEEFMILQNEMNIDKLNCVGPLYETAKQISNFTVEE